MQTPGKSSGKAKQSWANEERYRRKVMNGKTRKSWAMNDQQEITIQLGKPENPGPMKNDIEEMSMENRKQPGHQQGTMQLGKPEKPGPMKNDNHPTWKTREAWAKEE